MLKACANAAVVSQIYERDVMFRQQVGNLQLIVGIYNNVQATILPVEKPLITQKLEAVDAALKKGLQVCCCARPGHAFCSCRRLQLSMQLQQYASKIDACMTCRHVHQMHVSASLHCWLTLFGYMVWFGFTWFGLDIWFGYVLKQNCCTSSF